MPLYVPVSMGVQGTFLPFLKIISKGMDSFEEFFLYKLDNILENDDRCVDVRREVRDTWYDVICMTKPYRRQPIGSLGDSILFLPGDNDEVFLLENTVALNENEIPLENHCNFYVKDVQDFPGFCKLKVIPGRIVNGDIYISHDNEVFLSSTDFLSLCLSLSRLGSNIEKPFIGKNGLRCNYVIPLKSWPQCALAWRERARPRCWPSTEMIQIITESHACFCEPIGNSASKNRDMEWRISFALPETALMKSLNCHLFKLYQLLKIIAKEMINKHRECRGALSSYVLRTVLFWLCENGFPNVVSDNNLKECILMYVCKLEEYVENSFCPHYFVSEANIFGNMFPNTTKVKLLEIFMSLKNNLFTKLSTLPSLQIIQQKFDVREEIDPITLDDRLSFKDATFFRQSSGTSYCLIHSGYGFEILENIEYALFCMENSSMIKRSSLIIEFYRLASATGVILYHETKQKPNKAAYSGRRLSERMLKIGSKSDLVSGHLTLANMYYCRGSNQLCSKLTDKIMNNIQPFSIYFGKTSGFQNHTRFLLYKEIMTDEIIPLHLKMQRAFMTDSEIYKEQPVIPSCLTLELEFLDEPPKTSFIPALVHLHFLRFLCFHEMNMRQDENRAKEDLQTIMFDDEHRGNTFLSYNIAGICSMMTGDVSQATHYFAKSAILSKHENIPSDKNAGYMRIALLLNSRVNLEFTSDHT